MLLVQSDLQSADIQKCCGVALGGGSVQELCMISPIMHFLLILCLSSLSLYN